MPVNRRSNNSHGARSNGHGQSDPMAVARALGWFSIGLGLAELAFPHSLGSAIGLERRDKLLRAYGARELAAGAAILAAENPAPWVWGRVAGDAVDLITLAAGYREQPAKGRNIGLAIAAVAGVTALDIWCAQALDKAAANRLPAPNYSDRSGFSKPPEQMRGAARETHFPVEYAQAGQD